MNLFPAITITDSTPFTFRLTDASPRKSKLVYLEAWSDAGGASIYYGTVPGPAISVDPAFYTTGGTKFTVNTIGQDQDRLRHIPLGSVFSCADNAGSDGLYVVANDGRFLTMNAAFSTDASEVCVFTPPAVASTNGMVIAAGSGRIFTTEQHSRFLEEPIRFVVAAAATATLRIAYTIA